MIKSIIVTMLVTMPPFLKAFEDRYVRAMGEQYAQLIATKRCEVCHEGTSKKQRNEYGRAVGTRLKKSETDLKMIASMLHEVETTKASDDKTFHQRISEGRLPSP